MRVLVIDDSAFMRRAISQMLATDPQIEVVAAARNGREGVELAKQHKPDVITLDIEMPEMDGLTALRHIMQHAPTQVLMLSSLTTEGSHATLTALKLGAADFLAKDVSQVSLSVTNIQTELLHKVKALGQARRPRVARPAQSMSPSQQVPLYRHGQFDVILIGSSTGGPPVLETLVAGLPKNLSTPVVIAQHMPELFTRSMTERLSQTTPLRLVHVDQVTPLERGTVYVACGGKHLHVKKTGLAKWELHSTAEPKEAPFRPSVDVLFETAAHATAARTLAIVLTGIGDDGLRGGRTLRQKNGILLAQSEETCVVYGMPKAVTENGLIAASLSPEQMVQSLRTMADHFGTPLARSA